jgi:molecular chaperone GrpE
MTEKEKPNPQELEGDGLGDAPSVADSAGDGADSAADGNGEKGADVVDLMQQLDEAKVRAAELENKLLRAQADFENYRRRVQREKEDLAIYANQKLVLNLLPVLDNLDRALGTSAIPGDEKLRQGVELTARSFRDILAKEGVTAIDAVGKPFDPNFHEAVMTAESDEHEEDTVIAEFQKGYQMADRVIRPSMVQVSKKG